MRILGFGYASLKPFSALFERKTLNSAKICHFK